MDVVVAFSDIVVLIVQASLNHISQVPGAGVRLNGVQCQVDAGHNHGLLGVEQLRADNDLVDGDGSLNCVVLESSSEHSTLNV